MITGVFGNLLILLSIARNACLQTPTYALVANLAVLDILNSAVVVLSMIISFIYGSLRKPVPSYQRACMTLSRLNCLINPIIYGVFNRKMREAFRKLVCPNCSTKPRATDVPSSTEIHH
ncbi:uncharacterized protein [Amphiura filiformis]|uniref:uncharacterized protein n=1 Tax=Amphiura filiformis TaxID=82378 RepID=UPI003B220252